MSYFVQIIKHTEALCYAIPSYINKIFLPVDIMHLLKFVNFSFHLKHPSGSYQLLYCQIELISLLT